MSVDVYTPEGVEHYEKMLTTYRKLISDINLRTLLIFVSIITILN